VKWQDLETDLRRVLEAHRYKSKTGQGMRGLMPHHIDALVGDLLPFIHEQIASEVTPRDVIQSATRGEGDR
jgi:hypothetical protein